MKDYRLKIQVEEFLHWGSRKYRPSSLKTYKSYLKKFMDYVGEDKDVRTIDVMDFVGFMDWLERRSAVARSYMALHMSVCRMLWKFMYLREIVPLKYELIPVPAYQERFFVAATERDALKLMDAVSGESFQEIRDRAILELLRATGARVSEIIALNVDDMDMQKMQTIIVSRKTDDHRIIFWDNRADFHLQAWIHVRDEIARCGALFVSLDKRPKNRGKRLSTRSVQRMVSEARQKANMKKKITPHSFRHGFGVRLVKSKTHPANIRKLLGHRNFESSKRYMRLADPDLRNVYNEQNRIFEQEMADLDIE